MIDPRVHASAGMQLQKHNAQGKKKFQNDLFGVMPIS